MAYTPTDSIPDLLHPSITLTITEDGIILNPDEESSESSEEQSDSHEEIEISNHPEAELPAVKEEIEPAKEEIDEPKEEIEEFKEEVLEIIEVKMPLSAEIEIAKIEQPILIAYNASISANKPPLEKEGSPLVERHTQFAGGSPIRSPTTQRRLFSIINY